MKPGDLWDRLSLSARLLLTASAALLTAVTIMLYVSTREDARAASAALQNQLKDELQSVVAGTTESIVTGDFATLEQLLDLEARRDGVAHARYTDASGALVDSEDVPSQNATAAWFGHWLGLTDIEGSSPVTVGGRHYGDITIRLTPQQALNRSWFRFQQQMALLVLAIGLDFLGMWLVLRSGLLPLQALDEASHALASGDYDRRIPRSGSPELRHVIDAFNSMAEDVERTVRALAESEGSLSAILHSIGDGLIATDSTMRITFLNPIAESLLGWKQEEAAGRPVSDIFHIENAVTGEPTEIPVGRVIETGRVIGLANHTVLVSRDGRRIHISDSAAPVRDISGNLIGVVMVFRDVSESYRLRAALEEGRTRLSLALKGGDIALWDWNLRTGEMVHDERWAEALGYRLDEIPGDFASWENLVQVDDLLAVRRALDEHFAGRSPSIDVELRMRSRSGEWKWMLTRGRVTARDAQGLPIRVTGTHLDISERKRSEEDLRLAALAFETTEALFITDRRGIILRVNRAFSTITGFQADEAIGHRPGDLLRSGRQDDAFYAAFWRQLSEEGRWEGEIWNRRKNGDVFPEWLSVRSAHDAKGETTHYVASFGDMTERKHAQEEIERLAYYDLLTGLPNRRLFLDRLNQDLLSSRRAGRCGGLIVVDLDNFKHLNDARGHEAGDILLREVALRLTQVIKEGDTVARLGGDEFVVLLADLSPSLPLAASEARAVAATIREALGRVFRLAESEYYAGVSMGVALFPEGTETSEELMRRADTAVNRAKDSGRGTVCFFEPQMQEAVEARLALERDLREALVRNEFRLYLQGQFDASGQLVGVEALVRWEHPDRGLVLPGSFIPFAEESNLIVGIGEWMLGAAASAMHRFEAAGHHHLRLSVNVSPRQFREKDFVHRVRDTLAASGASALRLTLEITEGMLLADFGESIARMTELEQLGVRFSIDDFGTGYSSLAYLKRLPLRELKIDRGFVASLPRDADDAALVDTILAIARQLRLVVVAEGLENEGQFGYLKERGCDFFQGFYFGRPVPVETFLAQIEKSPGVSPGV